MSKHSQDADKMLHRTLLAALLLAAAPLAALAAVRGDPLVRDTHLGKVRGVRKSGALQWNGIKFGDGAWGAAGRDRVSRCGGAGIGELGGTETTTV